MFARYRGGGWKISKSLDPRRDYVARFFRKQFGPSFDVMIRAFH